jgi:hypothetical protein
MKRVRLLSVAGDEQPGGGLVIKRLFSVIFLALAVALLSASSASAASRFSVATGNWNATTTWSATSGGAAGASFPVAGDTVFIEGGRTVTLNVSSAAGSVDVATGSTLSVSASANTLTVSGNFTGSGTLANTGSAARVYNVGGDWTFSGTSTGALSLTLNGTGNQTLSGVISTATANTPALTINKASGSVILGSAITLGTTSTFTLTAGTFDPSTFLLTAVTPTFTAGTLRVGATTWAGNYSFAVTEPAVGSIEYYAAGAQTVNNVNTYGGDLFLSGSGVKTLGVSMASIGGDFTLSGSATATTVATLTVSGNLSVGDGTTLTLAGFAFTVTGTTAVGAGTSGNLTISSATGTKLFTGLVTINAGGTWTNTAANSPVTFRGGITNSGTFSAGTGIHTFNTNSQALIGTFSIPSVTVTGVTLTNNGTLTVTTALAGSGGLTNSATGTLNVNFTGAVGITTLTATAVGNTVNYAFAGAQTVKATTYDTLNLSSSGTKTPAAGFTVNSNVTIDSGVTLDEAAFTLSLSSATLTVNGTLDFTSTTGSVTSTAATSVLTMGSSGLIRTVDGSGLGPAAGASLIATATFTTTSIDTNGTVEYDGAAQTVTDRNYNNLTITNAGTKTWTLAGGRIVNGNVTISSNGLTMVGIFTVDVKGDWTNSGTFTKGTETINFKGSVAQTIGGTSATSFNNLTINNSAGVTLDTTGDVGASVSGVLTLSTDLTVDRAEALTQSGTSAGTGDVVGDVHRIDFGTTTHAYGNPNNQLTASSGTNSITVMDVNLEKGSAPPNFTSAVQRIYSLTPGAGSLGTSTATVQLHYLDAELNSNTAASLDFYKTVSNLWTDQGTTGLTRTTGSEPNNFLNQTGITGFSAWTFWDGTTGSAPTAVNLKRFGGASFTDGVALSWESGYEVNNLGYRLYREQNGLRTRVTPSVVAGSALKIGANQQMTAGYSYSWFDPKGTPGTAYYLEAIDLNGERQWTGPIYPASGYGESPVGKRRRAMLLSEVSAASSGQTGQQSWPASIGEAARNGSVKFRKESLGLQQQIAAGQAVKIAVRQSGWYRVSQTELVAAGLNASADARNLQLYVDGQQVPIRLSNDSVLGASDTLEFYGVALNTPTTDTHVYYLINGSTPGLRISNKRTKLRGTDLWNESVPRNFAYTTQRQDKLIYFPSLLNGETENIFGALIMTDPVSETIAIKGFDQQGSAQPQLEIALQGATKIDHVVQVQLNGASLGTINFSAVSNHTASFTLDRTQLHDGDNALTFVATNGQQDVSFVDWVRVTYAHPYTADNNALTFSVPAGQAARVDGFTNANIRVVDITDPNAVVEVPVSVGPSGAGYAAKLQTRSASVRTLIAFTDDLINHPAAVTANQPSSWNVGGNSADLVIITHKDFRQAIEPLAAQRRSQGLNVAVVDVEDVYDEFSYGAHTPYAVRDFLAWTTTHWQTTPQYVLLVGDSSWDPRNYLDQGNNDFVPTKLIDTSLMETMSDDWVADFNSDGLAEMAVGRLPGRTSAEVGLMVSKINAYEIAQQAGGSPRGALLVSDRGFEGQNSQTKALLSPSVPVQTIDRAQVNADSVMSSEIIDAINAGPMLVNYYGHGSVDVWTGAGVLNDANAATLSNNSRLSVFVIMTCLNGYAGDAYIDSLGEALMKAQNGGAAAVWASSGFTEPQPQFAMSTAFYQQAFGAQSPRIGDAIRNAKASIGDNDVRRTWILLGDPTMRLR